MNEEMHKRKSKGIFDENGENTSFLSDLTVGERDKENMTFGLGSLWRFVSV